MKKLILPMSLLAFAAAACAGDSATAPATTVSPASRNVAPSAMSTSTAPTSTEGKSSVCVAYSDALTALKAKLASDPTNKALAEKVAMYDEIVIDSCD